MFENPHTINDITSQGPRTKSHILFLIKALNLECMTYFNLGFDKTMVRFLGRGDIVGSTMEI